MSARRNIELKARVTSLDNLQATARRLSGSEGELLVQRDTFFRCNHGRLKLREFEDRRAELIAYARADEAGTKASEYHLVPVEDAAGLKAALADALGVLQVVRKHREVYLIDNVRIHLDQVEGLGAFLEMEAVIESAAQAESAHEQLEHLMGEFAISSDDVIACAYADLLAREQVS